MHEEDTVIPGSKNSASFETPFFKGKISGDNLNLFLTFFTFALSSGMAAWIWYHSGDAERAQKAVVSALERQMDLHQKMVNAVKENTCLLSLPQEKREQEFASPNSICKRLSQ